MKTLPYACIIVFFLLYGCSNSSKKDISKSSFYWTPVQVDKSNLESTTFFSSVHENNLGKYVFANENIERNWDDEDKFVTAYDMSELAKENLFCRLFVNQNSGPDKVYENFAKNPRSKRNLHLRYDYYLDSIHAGFYYKDKPTEDEITWESTRYPIFESEVIPEGDELGVDMSLTQEKIIEALLNNQKYVNTKDDHTILVGLKFSVVDGSSPGRKEKKKAFELASGQFLLTNVDKGLELINKHIPKYGIPEPFMKNKKLEEEALKLMQNYARNQGWKEKYHKAIITSDYNVKRSFAGLITGRTIIFALVGEWPDGRWTSQFFKIYQAYKGDDEYGPLRYDGTGKQRDVWGGALK